MSGSRSMHQSLLYGRPVTEWSTPPSLGAPEKENTKDHLHFELRNLSLNSESRPHVASNQLSVPQKPLVVKPPPQVQHQTTTNHLPKACYTTTSSQHKGSRLSSHHDTSCNFKPLTTEMTQMIHYETPRQQRKVASSTSLPTALVTPLPGSSPPQQTYELQGHGQPTHTCRSSMGLDGEGESQCKSVGWKGVEHELSDIPEHIYMQDENPVELIERWKSLIDAKDNIMKQKNVQIERQKTVISKLQQETRELEAKLHGMLVAQVRGHGGSNLEARLQALEAENSSIRAQLTEALSSRNVEICTISKKLDHKEYELHQVLEDHEQSSEEHQQQIITLQDEVSTQERYIRELEQKLAGSEAASQHHVEQLDRLNEYMGHMPSMEEHQALEKQSREMRLEYDKLTKHLTDTETSLKDALDLVKSKDLLLSSMEGVKTELENTRLSLESHKQSLAVVESKKRKLKQENEHLQKVVVEAERRCRQELQAMRERHRTRFMEATAKLRTQYKHLAKRARALETQLTRNSDAMMSLNSELQFSQGTIGALKTSVKELVSQNQELIDKNISLQESTAEAMKVSSSVSEAQSSAAQQLGVELSQCLEDFESLVGLAMSLLDGQEPTSTMLFGTDSHLLSSSMEASADCGLEARLDQVKHLRIRIEELRAVISEQFAAQLSAACNVQ